MLIAKIGSDFQITLDESEAPALKRALKIYHAQCVACAGKRTARPSQGLMQMQNDLSVINELLDGIDTFLSCDGVNTTYDQ